jgi:hypothetical protein
VSYKIIGFPTGRYRARQVLVDLRSAKLYYQINGSPAKPTVLLEVDPDVVVPPGEIVAEFATDDGAFDDKKKHGWVRLLSPDELIEFLVEEGEA